MHTRNRVSVLVGILSAALLLGGCVVVNPAADRSREEGRLAFVYVANNSLDTDTTGGYRLYMTGVGSFDPNNIADIEGGGTFSETDSAAPGTPKPEVGLGHGEWRVTKGLKWTYVGDSAQTTAGILEMEIELLPYGGEPIAAHLVVICNSPPGGLLTGRPEGYVLTVPGIGTFNPITSQTPGVPPFGLTFIGSNVARP